jgi:hypothetical protein
MFFAPSVLELMHRRFFLDMAWLTLIKWGAPFFFGMVLLATQSLKISEKEITTSTIHMLRGFVSRYFLLSDDCWITLELTMFMLHRL